MSYLDRTTDPRQRNTAIAGVIVIHALLGYVILTGLIEHITHPKRETFSGIFETAPPPPPPPPQQTQQEHPKKVEKATAPETKTDLTQTDNTAEVTREVNTVTDTLPKIAIADPPYTPPTPRFRPKSASPRNSPAGWAVTDDYPARDLREENEGVTVFRAMIGTDGRVSGCEIVKSSGHPGLDAATCKAVKARARFDAATDENGNKVAGTYSNSVLWQIPGR